MTHQKETTFKKFTAAEASAYKSGRGSYPSQLYEIIYDYHNNALPTGSSNTVIDLGCGPGNSTLPFAEKFQHVVGVDPSPGMVEVAKANLGAGQPDGETKNGDLDFVVGRAEDLGGLQSADMITAATAAHWFEMPKFWASAAKVLKPGGTVAFWAYASLRCHPSTPNAEKVQEILWRIEKEELAPYEARGNRICRDLYDELLLPWQCDPPVTAFPKDKSVRREWDRQGLQKTSEDYFITERKVALNDMETRFGSASMVIRWREAHPDLAFTKDDVVAKGMREIREVSGVEEMTMGKECVLLLFKRC